MNSIYMHLKQQIYIYYQQYQVMNTFQITSQLEDIYPDIEGQLCSKHTVLLNQIQKSYRKAFPMHPPTHYVISEAMIQLAKSQKSSVSMSMEQGTIIMYSAGQAGGQLHISGNLIEDLSLEGSGKLLNSENQSQISIMMRKMVELATQDLSLNKMNGGFLYIYFQNSIKNKKDKNSLLIALFMAIISLNNLLQEYSQEDLIMKLKSNQYLSSCDVQAYFQCTNNREIIIKGTQNSKIKLQPKYKLLFLSLDFINSQFNLKNQGDYLEEIISQLSKTNDIISFFSKIQEKMNQIYQSELLDQIKQTKQKLKIKTFIICQGYAIFLVQNYRYAELIGKISRIVHELHKKQPKEDKGELINRFSSQININSILFSSVPSRALSILDPSNCMWY